MAGKLFGGPDMPDEARERLLRALDKVARADVEELLSRDGDLLVDHYAEPFEPATVRWDDVTMTEPKQVSSTGSNLLGHRMAQQGATSTLRVPVDGDAMILTYRSHSGAPLHSAIYGMVSPGVVEFEWSGQLNAPSSAIQGWFAQRREHVETFLRNNNQDTIALNEQMRFAIGEAVERRKSQELQRRQLAANLPFPVERKPGATVPVRVTRTTVRLQERPESSPFRPEAELDQATYEDILRDCMAMSAVFERLPLGPDTHEEHLRNLLLATLNSNFTGQIGGEVFNGAGKTDLLIRHEDRNVFIGECKFYKGPKSVTAAVDQLLSYLVWRDTKAALLLFVRDGNFTKILEGTINAVGDHPRCQKQLHSKDPARRTDFIFSRADDPDRAIHLALLPYRLSS